MNRLLPRLLLLASIALAGCLFVRPPIGAGWQRPVGAGFRYSAYGPEWQPGPDYWARVGVEMAERFEGAVPETIWIVGKLDGEGTRLSFPVESDDPLISGSPIDANEEALDRFDDLGYRVWLQVEPGHAPIEPLIDLVLDRYAHHPSVVGFGVDVEWYQSTEKPEGKAVTDLEARSWLRAIRKHDPDYRLFLKHWLIEKMPPFERGGILFVDDSQILPSLDAMVDEFAEWGRAFTPAPVAFQYGYESDRPWWQALADPPGDVGRAILAAVPNTEGLYWVDFTAIELFPPAVAEAVVPAHRIDQRHNMNGEFYRLHQSFLERGREPMDLLFIGDSITQGWSWGDNRAIWDEHFGRWDPANFGISGDRTQHVLWRIDQGELDGIEPRVVVLMIGTNNIGDPAGEILQGVEAVVARIREKLPESRLLLLGIFPRGANPAEPVIAEMREKIETVNRALARLDDGDRVRYLDLRDRFLDDEGRIPETLMPDALHLSEEGYRIWAEGITPVIEEMMREK